MNNEEQNTVIDVIGNMFASKAKYFPYLGRYSRIASLTVGELPEQYDNFTVIGDSGTVFSEITPVFNKERNNLSIRFHVDGLTFLDNNCSEYGLDKVIKSRIYRTHTIVRDGELNKNFICTSRFIDGVENLVDDYVCVELDSLPIVRSHDVLYNDIVSKQIDVEAIDKSLKACKKLIANYRGGIQQSDDCVEYLKDFGLSRSAYGDFVFSPQIRKQYDGKEYTYKYIKVKFSKENKEEVKFFVDNVIDRTTKILNTNDEAAIKNAETILESTEQELIYRKFDLLSMKINYIKSNPGDENIVDGVAKT